MPTNPIPLKTILTLYQESKWPVPKIAKHFGVTRQALYERLRKSGVQLDPQIRLKRIDPEVLRKTVMATIPLYEAARRLGIGLQTLKREMKLNGITKPSNRVWRQKQPKLYELAKGHSILVRRNDPSFPRRRSLYAIAERSGFKITVETIDDQHYRVTRIS